MSFNWINFSQEKMEEILEEPNSTRIKKLNFLKIRRERRIRQENSMKMMILWNLPKLQKLNRIRYPQQILFLQKQFILVQSKLTWLVKQSSRNLKRVPLNLLLKKEKNQKLMMQLKMLMVSIKKSTRKKKELIL